MKTGSGRNLIACGIVIHCSHSTERTMPSSKLTLMVQVDVLRPDYITKADMPLLYPLGQEGVHTRVIPSFGFEPDGAYLTGTHPEQYQGGAHFVYRELGPPLPGTGWLPGWLDHLSPYLQYPLRRHLAEHPQ